MGRSRISLLRRASVRLLPVACTARFLGISRPLAWSSAVAIFYVLALYSCSSPLVIHMETSNRFRACPAIKRRHPEHVVAFARNCLYSPAVVRGRSSVSPAPGCSSLLSRQRGLERGFVLPVAACPQCGAGCGDGEGVARDARAKGWPGDGSARSGWHCFLPHTRTPTHAHNKSDIFPCSTLYPSPHIALTRLLSVRSLSPPLPATTCTS